MRHLTNKQETACLKYVELGNATQALIESGYSPKYAFSNTTHVFDKPWMQARIKELRQKAEDETVMNVLQRKQRLSEIGRARLTDFMELGQDGSWVNLGPETELSGAIQEIHSRTEYDKDSAKATVHTSVKLHSPIQAIDLLNKMDKIYSDGAQVNVDNRKIEIFVVSEKAKELTEAIMRGERTQLTA